MTIKVTYNITDVYMSQSVSPVYINVSYSDGGASGGGVWGSITGTLSNQTDLQTALDLKVPYSGATGDVSLGEYGINVGNVIYDTTPTGIPTEQGATYWDADAETVALIMNGTIQKVGEDTFYHVRNTTGSTIAKGTAVRFSGTTGNSGRLLIAPMLSNGTYPSQYYMGITSEEIANNQDGKVYHFGKMRNINTSAFADGDVLYVSPSVAGALTATAPVAPNNIIVAAAVVHAANSGTLMIRTTLGSNINADEGVLLTTPTANQGLFYDSGLWVNKSITTALGYTPVPTTRNITINGVTYDLSADRTWTIAAGISGSGSSGQVTYWTGASAVSGSNNLFWDNTNGRLGIGTNAPAYLLDVNGEARINNTTQYIFGTARLQISTAGVSGFYANNVINWSSATTFTLQRQGGTVGIRINSTDNVSIGATTDGGQKFQVYGDTLLRGSGNTNSTTALTVQNSDSTNLFVLRNDGTTTLSPLAVSGSDSTPNALVINQTWNTTGTPTLIRANVTDTASNAFSWVMSLAVNGTQRFGFRKDGVLHFGAYSANPAIGAVNGTGTLTANGEALYIARGLMTSTGYGIHIIAQSGTRQPTTGVNGHIRIAETFNPTSGTGTYDVMSILSTINQTGGANGITRGLYVNPTLAAAADWRSIEWSNNSGWGLYGSGTAPSFFNGSVGIGTTATGNYNLRVTKNLTGSAIFFNVLSSGAIQSDVTTQAHYFRTGASSANATFTIPNLYHYTALQDSFGASSTITNQYGFFADLSITGATNNYGFYGNISSGTGRWNLYMNGTADNYLAGNLGIGITPTVRLHVSGDTILRGSGATSATTALTVQNSSSTNLFTVRNDGLSTVNKILSSTGTESQGTLISGSAITRYTSNTGVNTNAVYANATSTSSDVWISFVAGSATSNIYTYFQSSGYIGTRGALRLGAANGTDVITSITNTWLSIAAGTTSRSQINLAASTAPTTPNDGDIWFDGTDIKMRIGGVTKTFTLI